MPGVEHLKSWARFSIRVIYPSFLSFDFLYRLTPLPFSAGDAASPLLSSKSSMNTMIEGGDNKKQTGRLQKAQSMAGKESASEVALKACFARVREISQDLGLPSSIQVRFYVDTLK